MKKLKRYMLFNSETSFELGEVQISLHKIMHVDWFRFCALRHDDEAREMLAEIADNCVSEEERQPGKRLEHLDSFASEDAFQTALASQPNTHFSKYYFCGLVRR